MQETRYQRIAREQAERRAKREQQAKRAMRTERKKHNPYANTYMRDPDGYDRDNLGESPDF